MSWGALSDSSSVRASPISGSAGVGEKPCSAAARAAAASAERWFEFLNFASASAARRAKLRDPCVSATAIAVSKASSAAASFGGIRGREDFAADSVELRVGPMLARLVGVSKTLVDQRERPGAIPGVCDELAEKTVEVRRVHLGALLHVDRQSCAGSRRRPRRRRWCGHAPRKRSRRRRPGRAPWCVAWRG